MQVTEPYFMKNPEWFEFNEELFKYVLTNKATPEAIRSYNDFYEMLDGVDEF